MTTSLTFGEKRKNYLFLTYSGDYIKLVSNEFGILNCREDRPVGLGVTRASLERQV